MRQARRILIFYFFLLCANLGIFFYEVWLVGMSLDQSLVARVITLATDVVEAILFINSSFFQDLAISILKACHVRTWNWIESGLKLAVIGPTIYGLKLLIFNSFLCCLDLGIKPIGLNKIWLAYSISFSLSFSWGAVYALFLEDMANSFLRLFRKKLLLIQE